MNRNKLAEWRAYSCENMFFSIYNLSVNSYNWKQKLKNTQEACNSTSYFGIEIILFM